MKAQTHLDIGTSKLGYRRAGNGPDIVFVHGWPLNKETWRNVVPHLANYTCHLIDLPGCGDSITPAEEPVSLRRHAETLIRAVDALGLDSVVLAGHDSGGMIARFAAARMPERVRAMLLAGTEIPHVHPKQIEQLQMVSRLPGAAAVTKFLMNRPRLARSNSLLGSCFWDRDLIEGDFRTNVLDKAFGDTASVRRQLEALASYTPGLVDELEEAHARITCPSLLIWGAHDPYFPVERARAMCGQFSGPTSFEVLENARLLVHEEHPKAFATLCAAFLDGVTDGLKRGTGRSRGVR